MLLRRRQLITVTQKNTSQIILFFIIFGLIKVISVEYIYEVYIGLPNQID